MMDTVAFKRLTRPHSPNTYLVAPEGLCDEAEPDHTADHLQASPAEVYRVLTDLIADRADWSIEEADEKRGLIHFIATSRLMRFKDDVNVLILPDEARDKGTRLAIYSRSRVGHSDLGANRKRVVQMLTNLNKMLVKT